MGYVVTSVLVRNESKGITFTSLTTLRAIIKYATRPKSAACSKRYQRYIDIADFGFTNIDIVSILAKATSTNL